MSKTNKIFKQRRVKFLGEVIDTIFTAMPVLSAYAVVSTTIVMYELVKQYILNVFPWMNIWIFIGCLVLLFLPILLVFYKWVIPSVWGFRSEQMSHLERKIDILQNKLDTLIEQQGLADEDSSR